MTLQLRPTFSESWYRVKDLSLRLRPTAQISRQYYRGERWYVVRDPASNQFHRLSDAAYRFVGLLDGSVTVGQAWEIVGGQMDDMAPTQPEVIQILTQLYAANLVETNISPDAQVLLRRHKQQKTKKLQGRLMNLLFPRIPLWDPDNFLRRWLPAVGPIMSWGGMIVWLVVVAVAIALLLPKWEELGNQTSALFQGGDPVKWMLLGLTFVGVKFIHEMGHAFSCRRFGGECHEVGIMFLVLFPCPYVDASTAWGFPNKWKRIFVGAAGMIAEIFCAAIAAIIFFFTDETSLTSQLAYNVMLVAGVSTILFNANPLLRYDGYYILSDWLEIPNLQHKSREYTLGLVRRYIYRVKETKPLPPKSQRWQLVLFNITSSVYRIFIGFAIMLMVLYQLPEEVKVVGLIMGLGAITTFFIVPIFKLIKYLLTDPELHRKRAKAWVWTLSAFGAIVLLVGLIQFPSYVWSEGVIEPALRETVRVEAPGRVEEVFVRNGENVEAGQIIARLSNPDLELALRQAEAEYQAAKIESRAAMMENMANFQALERQAEYREESLKKARADFEELSITAPIAGRFIAQDPSNYIGAYMQLGQELGRIDQRDELEVIAYIDQQSRDRMTVQPTPEAVANGWVQVRPAADTGVTLAAVDWQVDQAPVNSVESSILTVAGGGAFANDPTDQTGRGTSEDLYVMRMTLRNPGENIVTGQRTYVRARVDKEPLIVQGWRKLLQVIQSQSTAQAQG
ncbi:MAG: biotin/lipoyl-binding protein [Planctomycetota bacterium]